MNTLTLEIAKTLIGKEIKTHYYGYRGQDGTDQFVVGEIINEYELGKREGWNDHWNEQQIEKGKSQLRIITADDRNTFISCHLNEGYFNEPTFTCSDADRPVSYELA